MAVAGLEDYIRRHRVSRGLIQDMMYGWRGTTLINRVLRCDAPRFSTIEEIVKLLGGEIFIVLPDRPPEELLLKERQVSLARVQLVVSCSKCAKPYKTHVVNPVRPRLCGRCRYRRLGNHGRKLEDVIATG